MDMESLNTFAATEATVKEATAAATRLFFDWFNAMGKPKRVQVSASLCPVVGIGGVKYCYCITAFLPVGDE